MPRPIDIYDAWRAACDDAELAYRHWFVGEQLRRIIDRAVREGEAQRVFRRGLYQGPSQALCAPKGTASKAG